MGSLILPPPPDCLTTSPAPPRLRRGKGSREATRGGVKNVISNRLFLEKKTNRLYVCNELKEIVPGILINLKLENISNIKILKDYEDTK